MHLLRRHRSLDPPHGEAASTSAPGTQPSTPRPSSPASQHRGIFRSNFDKDAAIARMKSVATVALDVVQKGLPLAADATSNVPVPGLSIGLKALAEILRKVQTMNTNISGVQDLADHIEELVGALQSFRSGDLPLPRQMLQRMEKQEAKWQQIEVRAQKIKGHGKIVRFLTSDADAKALQGLVDEMNKSIQDDMLAGIRNIERDVDHIRNDVGRIHKVVQAIAAKVEVSFLPTYAKMAPYNANEVRRSCLEGTRVEFLNKIYTSITAACNQRGSVPTSEIVMWINGLGGTGKTTVARSVAEWCDKKGILAGSFFCFRSDESCSDPTLVFPSLCRQLCGYHQPFKDKVESVLERIPDIAEYGPHRQFEELIVLPLEELGSSFPKSVFVFDAIDELKDKGSTTKSTVLSAVAKFAPRIAKSLLLVMTSRPEEDITAFFESERRNSLKGSTTPLPLRSIPMDVALRDVRLYVNSEFEDKVGDLAIEPDWPSEEEKNMLVEQSRGLFIYVATAIKFVMDKRHRDPKGRIDLLKTALPKSSTPHEFLTILYTTILVASYEGGSSDLASRLQNVLGAIVLAQEALSPLSVARLVGLDVSTVKSTLTGLHSVLHIPTADDEPIRIIHPTFPEFLLHPPPEPASNSPNVVPASAHLHLEPVERHWYLFSRCLEVMSRALKRDMIGIRYPAMWQSEVENLKEKIAAAIKPHVRYACRFWADHLRDGAGCAASLDVPALFWKFVHKLLLYWIETCSLLDAMDKVIFALDAAQRVCQMLGGRFADLAPLLADCRRFAATYSPCIHSAPLQIYYSALGLSPTTSQVRTTYSHEREHALIVGHGAYADWAPCLDTFAGHGGQPVLGVAFAPDGSCFVTGGCNNEARIWKTATRTAILAFGEHSGWVRCVAFSPDGLHVASGGDDCKVFVWQASSGDRIHTLGGHSDWVHSVAYSGDGRRILSATKEGEVKLWDAADGRCLLTLDKTGNDTCQVGISFDGGVIVRGVRASVSMHNVSTAASEALEVPGIVVACTFSPDGRYIAARSHRVIRVWAWPDKTPVRSIDVSDSLVLTGRLAFSRDGTLIGCGSRDGAVHLWKVASQDPPHTLHGHTQYVYDLAFSRPDDSQVVSVALDGMIRVWDRTLSSIASAEHTAPAPPTPAPGLPRFALIWSGVNPIALLHLPTLGIDAEHFALRAQMPDGAPTATLFPDAASAWDTALQHLGNWYGGRRSRVWTSLVGGQHAQLSGRPFAISLDGSLMAYPSPASDEVVDVCDLRKGMVVATLTGHTDDVCSIAFSPDSTRIATGSSDGSVKVWDTLTGTVVCGHTDHPYWAHHVAFSPDGCLVASGSSDDTVCIFEVATQRVVRVLGSHRNSVVRVMFAADNIHVVALDLQEWVYVWDVATGACLYEFSLHDHDHLCQPFFLPDDTGILIGGGDGTLRTVSLWQPGTRAWPAYHITQDGWVYALSPSKSRRLGWLSPEWRALLRFDGSRLYVTEPELAESTRRRLVVLNLSQIEACIDSLDESR